jgi:hypothetical protein
VDALDSCCQAHDRCYDVRGWGACSCDRALIACTIPIGFTDPATVSTPMGMVARVIGQLFTVRLIPGTPASCDPTL